MKKKEAIDSSVSIALFDDDDIMPSSLPVQRKPEVKHKNTKKDNGNLHEGDKHTVSDTGGSIVGSWHSAKKKVEKMEEGDGKSDRDDIDKHDGRVLGNHKGKNADTKAERGTEPCPEIGKSDAECSPEYKEHIDRRRKSEPAGGNREAEERPAVIEKDKQVTKRSGSKCNYVVKRLKDRYQTTSSLPGPSTVERGPIPIKGEDFLVRITVNGVEKDVSPWSIKNGVYIPGLDSEFLVHCFRPNTK